MNLLARLVVVIMLFRKTVKRLRSKREKSRELADVPPSPDRKSDGASPPNRRRLIKRPGRAVGALAILALALIIGWRTWLLYDEATRPWPVSSGQSGLIDVVIPRDIASATVKLVYDPNRSQGMDLDTRGFYLTVRAKAPKARTANCLPFIIRTAQIDPTGLPLVNEPLLQDLSVAPALQEEGGSTGAEPVDSAKGPSVFRGEMCQPWGSHDPSTVMQQVYFGKLANGMIGNPNRAVLYQVPSLRIYRWQESAINQLHAEYPPGSGWGGVPTTSDRCVTSIDGMTADDRLESIAPPASGPGLLWTGCGYDEKTALIINIQSEQNDGRYLFIAGGLLGFAAALLLYIIELSVGSFEST